MRVQRVGVAGAGTMGAGIAQLCAQAGFSVKVHDPSAAALESLPRRLAAALEAAALKGRITLAQAERARHSVLAAPRLEDLSGADLVIEAAPEDLALKKPLLERLSVLCPGALLATNTSSLSVARSMEGCESPERTLGMHFFNPPAAMKLVELVRWEKTSDEALRAAWDFALAGLARTPVLAADRPGFIVNRVMRPYYVLSQSLAAAGGGFSSVDAACRSEGGVPMGPFELMDLIGLDTNLAITRSIYEALGRPARFEPPALQAELVRRGALGRKSGRGFYLYESGRPSGENPEALALLPPGPGPGAPWPALREALSAEAELLVAEGGAGPGDVDAAVRLAMNFPRGPLEWRGARAAP